MGTHTTSDTATHTAELAPSRFDTAQVAGTKKNKLFVALPVYWNVDPHFWTSTLKLCQELAFRKDIDFSGILRPQVGDSAIGRSRNSLTRQFLETDATHLLFIDSDLVFSTDQIIRLMQHKEEVVGGLYCKKQEGPPQLVINSWANPEQRGDLLEVRYIGTGFMRVARSVFEKMIERWGREIEYKLDPDHKITEWDFWHMGVYHYPDGSPPRYLSEDWWFCQKCIDLGIKIWADRRIALKHSGAAMYPLSYQQETLFGQDEPCLSEKTGAGEAVPTPAPPLSEPVPA